MKPEFSAIHRLRSKQEENELGYWLSFAAYDQKDSSLINKAYLLYLVIFLFIWLMMMLFFFAKFGGMALSMLNSNEAANTTVSIEWLILACWNLYSLIKSARRSPVVFSETDQVIACQTPVSRRVLILRWLWMPWLKSALLFWLMALILGFSTAELNFAGADSSNAIFTYIGFGLRALLQIIPIHLAFYLFQWSVGVLRLSKDDQKKWLMFPAIAIGLIPFGLIISNNALYSFFGLTPLNLFMNPGYINGSAPSSFLVDILSDAFMLILLFFVSRHFNLNRAARETSEIELVTNATRYGFTDLIEQRRTQNRLSSKQNISISDRHRGGAVLIWKNQLQTLRGWGWKKLLPLWMIFSLTLGLALLPGFLSKMLALFFLVFQLGPLLTPRLRSDLACWPILQQLPIRKSQIIIYDLAAHLPLLFIICILGLGVSAIITHTFALGLTLLLPGLLATIGFTSAIDIFRKSKSDLLINGSVPSVGTQGVILGLIGSVAPLWIVTTFPGLVGTFIAVLTSLLIAWICYKIAVFSFRNIKIRS